MGDVDVVDQLSHPGDEPRLRQVRPDPGVQRRGVLPLLEQDGLLRAVGLESAGELHVEEPVLLPQEGDLPPEERVEGPDPAGTHSGPEDANDH